MKTGFWKSRWLWALAVLIALQHCQPVDSTDESRWGRSGLRLHVDALTGCHYLSTMFGGPTPRLDSEGKQICIGVEE